jgi:hypothetical protein
LKYFIDSSNFDVKITRNKLRLEILPPFAKINKNYKENIANLINYLEEVKENIDEEVKRFLSLPISYDMLFPTSKMKNSKIKKKFYVILGNEKRQNPPNLLYQEGKEQNVPNPIHQGGKEQTSPNPPLSRRGINQSPLDKGGQRGVFEISAFNSLSSFMQKEVIRYIYFISN